MNNLSTRKRNGKSADQGYTLIEVLVGIVIFALGMMALASLQGNLARNSGDSNARTVAINVAEEIIEDLRTFGQLPVADPPGSADAYADIVSGTQTVDRGGLSYTATRVVTDYYYDNDTGTFGTTNSESAAFPDIKLLELTVTWNSSQEFQIDETNSTSGRLGSGSITLTDIISSFTTGSTGKVALVSADTSGYAPPVDYTPGENPEIVSIRLGDNKFKESTTPLPDVIRINELVETKFDVVTYSQDNDGATFLRREEFRAVSCECTLRIPDADNEGGLRPTIWDGYQYTEAEFVSKPYGESANNQQSDYCSICCRDHHDGGSGDEDVALDPGRSRFNPFRSSSDYHSGDGNALAGDHKHYNRNLQGDLVLAESDGDTYVEACRMVRKNGFFRIAQDLRQEGLNSFPANYLDEDVEVEQYSGYVTAAVSEYESDMGVDEFSTGPAYEASPPTLVDVANANLNPPVTFPASSIETATTLPTAGGDTEQQLRARGIYIDYMSDELREKINCLDAGGDSESCDIPNVNSAMEIIPFYDVQLTWLSRWNESPNNNPVDVTNEAISNNNGHSRGKAMLQSGYGYSKVSSKVHKGNLGLTGTDPIDPWYIDNEKGYLLYALAYDGSLPPPLTDIKISGLITSTIPGVKAADVEISANGAQCDRTNTGFECYLEVGAINPRLTITNYDVGNKAILGCSLVLDIHGSEINTNRFARFNLPSVTTTNADIILKEDSC
jgi:prepilin-type N-terminal cleavage/methylation domain-containing protein